MRICITLDDVIRAKTKTFGKVYKKYVDKDIDLNSLDLGTNNMMQVFGFKDKAEYNKFVYEDYPFELFAEAPVTERMVDKRLNLWHIAMTEKYGPEVTVILANPYEFNTSIGFTCFFLSQIATRIREIYFPVDSADIWNKCDLLVTADPKLLSEKPEGKTSVKIKMPYNEDVDADYVFDTFGKFLDEGENIIEELRGNV